MADNWRPTLTRVASFQCLKLHGSLRHYKPCGVKILVSPSNTDFFSLETSFSLYMPLMHRISISVQALTPKLNLSPLPALTSRLVTLTTPTHYRARNIVSTLGKFSSTHSDPKQPSLTEMNPLQGESSVF